MKPWTPPAPRVRLHSGGFVVLRGDRKALADVRFSEKFERLTARASAIIDSLGVIPAYGGEALAQEMGIFQDVADAFGA